MRIVVASLVALALLLLGFALFRAGDPDARPPDQPPTVDGDGAENSAAASDGTEPGSEEDEPPLDRDLDLHGRVEDGDGRPVPGAEVVVHEYARAALIGIRPGPRGDRVRLGADLTDEAGAFRVRLPHSRQVTLDATADGYAPLSMFPCYSGERLVLTLRRSARLTVRVVHADERPAASAWVRVRGGSRRTGSTEHTGEADVNGEIAFDDVPTGIGLSASAQAVEAGAFSRQKIPPLDGVGGAVTIVIPVGMHLRGLVRDAKTKAGIEGAAVSPGSSWPRSAHTAADGSFSLDGFSGREGSELTVSAEGYATQKAVVPEDKTLVVDLVPGIAVRGKVTDGSGGPIRGARVTVTGHRYADERWSNTYGEAVSDAAGRFTINGIDGSFPLILKVEMKGYGRREVELETPTDEDIDAGEIRLTEGGAVSGRVLTEDGGAARRTTALLQGPLGGTALPFGRLESRLTDDLGRFAFPDLAAGKYQVYVRQSGGKRVTVDVTVDEGEAVEDVVLEIAAQWTLRVAVQNERSERVVGIRVTCRTKMGGTVAKTDGSGVAVLRGAGIPERLTVEGADAEGVIHVGPEVHLDVRDVEDVTIRVEAAGRIDGVVIGPDGKPIAGAIVEARRDGGKLADVVADEEGRFTISVPTHGATDLVFGGMVRHTTSTGGWYDSPGALRGRREGVRAGGPAVEIEAAPPPVGGELVVSVVSGRGVPVAGVLVFAEDEAGADLGAAVTGPEGKARLEGLPRFEVRVGIDRGAPPTVRARVVDAGGREVEILGTDRVAALARFAMADGREVEIRVPEERLVTGRVEGAEITRGRVVLEEHGVEVGAGEIGPDGRFSAFLTRDGSPLHLTATAKGHDGTEYDGTADVSPGARDVAVVLSLRR